MSDDLLSQDEIDALLNSDEPVESEAEDLTDQEKDAMGEIGNISMGTAATTLYTLLDKKVEITTPRVELARLEELGEKLDFPHILIHIAYKAGIEGTNLLILREEDVKVITDLMMGGDGTNLPDELTDLHLSAISEAMNQMIGSASTSLSEMLEEKIDISPPEAISDKISETDLSTLGLNPEESVVKVSFDMKIGDLIDSQIMQILPIEVCRQLVSKLTTPEETVEEMPPIEEEVHSEPVMEASQPASQATARETSNQVRSGEQVNAQALKLNNFDDKSGSKYYNNDIELIKNVPLEISVELGRTRKKISEILEVGKGTVIELDRVVGESLNVLANGKIIAQGEVVVVDENYGVRITNIIKNEKIIENL